MCRESISRDGARADPFHIHPWPRIHLRPITSFTWCGALSDRLLGTSARPGLPDRVRNDLAACTGTMTAGCRLGPDPQPIARETPVAVSRTFAPTSWALVSGMRESGALTLMAAMGIPRWSKMGAPTQRTSSSHSTSSMAYP